MTKYLRGSSSSSSLSKVRAHVTLKVEVGKGVILTNLEKLSQLLVRVNLATILLVLKVVLTDVGIQAASDISAGHLNTGRLRKERSKLVRNASGLHETARGTGGGLSLALRVLLLGNSQSAGPLLLEGTILGLE